MAEAASETDEVVAEAASLADEAVAEAASVVDGVVAEAASLADEVVANIPNYRALKVKSYLSPDPIVGNLMAAINVGNS